ncbi:hypothetical protein NP493_2073g00004 [Ridgeia piscesae]|uniref:Uncharacterized protein n=1 Tax=Ridgeia piscesae TaxID=27915 RepID=A0AAD9N5W1_RIDPI|nr:hypothetical protein NP493_2073g00004 [Ridgeia piscesae]
MHKLPDIKQKRYYDHGSNLLKPLETTDTVRVRGDGVWSEKAQVLARVAPNSYLVELERGKRLRRNRRHLLKTQERFVPVHDDDDDREKENNPIRITLDETKGSLPLFLVINASFFANKVDNQE